MCVFSVILRAHALIRKVTVQRALGQAWTQKALFPIDSHNTACVQSSVGWGGVVLGALEVLLQMSSNSGQPVKVSVLCLCDTFLFVTLDHTRKNTYSLEVGHVACR